MSRTRKIEKVAANLDELSKATEELADQRTKLPDEVIDELQEGLEETSELVEDLVDEESDLR